MHALEKRPEERPPDAGAFRRELFVVAEQLGLEHYADYNPPSLETLRSAGTETPSGRLVIDIERLREQRAASTSGAREITLLSGNMGSDGQPAKDTRHSSSDSVMAYAEPVAAGSPSPALIEPGGPVISRINVPVSQKRDLSYWLRQPAVLIVGLFVLVLIVAIVAASTSKSLIPTQNEQASQNVTPTPEASPTVSPEPSPNEDPNNANHKRAERNGRPTSRRQNRKREASKVGKFVDKLKKVIKKPF
jgi:hypothetical protein